MITVLPASDRQSSRLARLAAVVRAGDWWACKIAVIVATGFATADVLIVSPVSLWRTFGFLLVALVPVAMFASVINDHCDFSEDRIAGKRNLLDGMARPLVAALFAACLIPGVAVAVWLRHAPATVAIYAANWLVFALYSLPPVRLKSRAHLGIVAIALGESLLPHLFAASVTAAAASRDLPPTWTVLVAIWSFAVGTRSILWHQLKDHETDRRAGIETFAVKVTPVRAVLLGRRIVFPLEIAAFLGMLYTLNLEVAWILLGVDALTEFVRHRSWKVSVVVVTPAPGDRLAMFEYYDMFHRIACIAGSIRQDPANWILLAIVAVSTRRPWWWCRDAGLMAMGMASRLWHLGRHFYAGS